MILVIVILGLVLRLISINQSLWLDEAINVLAVKNNSLWYIITKYPIYDFHPPGYFIILWLWTRLVGFSELSVRLPSVIFGTTTIWSTYLLGRKMFSNRVGLIAAFLLSVNPLHIYYSQEARMYAFATLSVVSGWLLLQSKVNYLLSSILILSSDYLAYFVIPVQLWFKKSNRLWTLGVVGVIGLIGGGIFLNQLHEGITTAARIPGWKQVVGSFGFKPLLLTYIKFIIGRIGIENHLIYGLIALGLGFLFTYLVWRGFNKLLFAWLAFPLVITWLISIFLPIFSYFRVLFLLPAFILLIANGIVHSKQEKLFLFLVGTIFLISSLVYLLNPRFQREDWRGLTQYQLTNHGNKTPVILEASEVFAPLLYYEPIFSPAQPVQFNPGLRKIPALKTEDVVDISYLSVYGQVVYLEYLADITDPQRLVQKKIEEMGFRQKEVKNFNGVGFLYQYQK